MSACEKVENFSNSQKCIFCDSNINDELKLGSVYKYGDIVVHYFCLLLSSSMEQNGKDEDGIYGFLPEDIKKEVKRGRKLRCSVCKKSGATLGCSVAKCKTIFHLPCGLSKGSLHQFYGQFKSFCVTHRPRQRISDDVLQRAKLEPATCVICYDSIMLNDDSTMWAPCCKKNAFFHRVCVQKLANSFGGYAFRCPLCNDQRVFTKAMKDFGIFVPDRDASWEQEENAFNELLYRHNKCDAQKCICPHGRTYSKKTTRWYIILCHLCGSQGIHHACRVTKTSDWQCDSCVTMLRNAEKGSGSDDDTSESVPTTNELPVRNSHPDLGLSRISDPCSSNRSTVSSAASNINRTVKKGQCVRSPSSDSSKSKSRSRSSSKSSSRSSSLSRVSTKSEKSEEGQPKELQRSRSNVRASRSRSSSSASVVSVARSISPIIVIDSDNDSDDVEVVADVSRSMLVNREGNKIQIVQIVPDQKPENVEIQGDINVKNVRNVECGVRMSDDVIPPRGGNIFKRRKTVSRSTSASPDVMCIEEDSIELNKSGANRSFSNIQQVNVELVSNSDRNVCNVPNTSLNINLRGKILCSSDQLNTGQDFKFANRPSVNTVHSLSDRRYHVYTPPNRGNLQIKTSIEREEKNSNCSLNNSVSEESKTALPKLPSSTLIKFRSSVPQDARSTQVGKSHANFTAAAAASQCSTVAPSIFYNCLQHHSALNSRRNNPICQPWFSKENSSIIKRHDYINRNCQQQEHQKDRFWISSFKSRYNHFGLKELKVVLTPMTIKVMKSGAIKVVQRKLKNHVRKDRKFYRYKLNKIKTLFRIYALVSSECDFSFLRVIIAVVIIFINVLFIFIINC